MGTLGTVTVSDQMDGNNGYVVHGVKRQRKEEGSPDFEKDRSSYQDKVMIKIDGSRKEGDEDRPREMGRARVKEKGEDKEMIELHHDDGTERSESLSHSERHFGENERDQNMERNRSMEHVDTARVNELQQRDQENRSAGSYSGRGRRLSVGNLHSYMKEHQLRQVFEPFGMVELVQLPSDPDTGLCKGYGFVQFSRLEDARAALSLDGQLDIAGLVMKVSAVTDHAGAQGIDSNTGDFEDNEFDHSGTLSSTAGSLGSNFANNPSICGAASVASPIVFPFGIPIPALAGWPAEGLSIPAVTIPSFNTVGNPSECLLLKNIFDPKLESEPDFIQDIKDDVKYECSAFGKLKHIYVDKKSAGFVYVRFENSQSAVAAQRALHGRWFGGRMITATFMARQRYEARFPESH